MPESRTALLNMLGALQQKFLHLLDEQFVNNQTVKRLTDLNEFRSFRFRIGLDEQLLQHQDACIVEGFLSETEPFAVTQILLVHIRCTVQIDHEVRDEKVVVALTGAHLNEKQNTLVHVIAEATRPLYIVHWNSV